MTLTVSPTPNHGLEESKESTSVKIRVIIQPTKDYPHSFPQISIISEHLSREQISDAKTKALDYCSSMLGEPIMVMLSSFLKGFIQNEVDSDKLSNKTVKSESCSNIENSICTCVLHIDHMRSKTKYCKTLEKWTEELNLCGRLAFCNKLILVILQGKGANIKVNTFKLCFP